MSRTIDEKIVEMQFDNRNFERNVATSMSTLDKLQEKLKFGKSTKSLEELDEASRKLNFNGMANGVMMVSQKFNLMYEVSRKAFDYISNGFTRLFGNLTQFTSLEMVKSGMDKYGEKTKAVQTIMSATGESIETVNEQLEQLNWFTDETSYNFTDMVNNIGKFTAAGIDLKTATSSMEGIANWAAISGAGISEASRAMYNLAQAIGMGSLQLMDWKSIENANMGTKQFKEMALEAGVARKELVKLGKDAQGVMQYALASDVGKNGQLKKGKESINYSNFRNSLSDKWFTNDVLTTVLQQYGGYAQAVQSIQDALGYDSASETMRKIDKVMRSYASDETISNLSQIADELNITEDEASALLKTYNSVGKSAFKAAQEAKTWTDVVDATRDAVGSKWMNIFESVFGDYKDAKILWTNIAEEFYNIFASPIESIGDLISGALYHKESWSDLTKQLSDLGTTTEEFEKAMREATSDQSYSLDELIEQYGSLERVSERGIFTQEIYAKAFENLGLSASNFDEIIAGITEKGGRIKILDAFSRLYLIFKGSNEEGEEFSGILNTIGKAFREVFPKKTSEDLKELIDRFYSFAMNLSLSEEQIRNFHDIAKAVFDVLKVAFNLIGTGFSVIRKVAGPVLSKGIQLLAEVSRWISNIINNLDFSFILDFFDKLKNRFSPLADVFNNTRKAWSDFFKGFLNNGIKKEKPLYESFLELIGKIIDKVIELGKVVITAISDVFTSNSIKDIGTTINTGLFGTFLYRLIEWIKGINDAKKNDDGGFFDRINKVVSNIASSIETLSKAMEQNIKAKTIKQVAVSIGILAGSLLLLAMVDDKKLVNAVLAIGTVMVELGIAMKSFNSIRFGKTMPNKLKMLRSLSVTLVIVAAAMRIVAKLDWSGIARSTVGIGLLLAELAIASKKLKNVNAKGLVSLGGSLIIFAVSLRMIAGMDAKKLMTGIVAIGLALSELVIAIKTINKIKMGSTIDKKMKSIRSLVTSLLLLSVTMKVIGGMSWEEIGKGLISIAAGMAIFAVAMNSMKGGKNGAGSVIALATAMLLLVPVIAILGKMKGSTIAKGLLAIAGAFAVLTVAGYAMKGIDKTLLSVAASMALIGIGVLSLSTGIIALTTAISVGANEITSGLYLMISTVLAIIPMVVTAIANGIISFVEAIANSTASIVDAVVKIGKAVLKVIRELVPDVVTTVLYLITELLKAINYYMPIITDEAFKLVITFINGISKAIVEHGPELLTAIGNLLNSIILFVLTTLQTLLRDIPVIGGKIDSAIGNLKSKIEEKLDYSSMNKLGKMSADGLADGLSNEVKSENSKSKVAAAIGDLTSILGTEIGKMGPVMQEAGEDTASGYAKGLESDSSKRKVKTAASSLGTYAEKFLRLKLDSHSPSKLFMEIGADTGEGFAIGIANSMAAVKNSSGLIGDEAIDSISNSINAINNAISINDISQPVIRPVMDLTNVNNGVDKVSSMFGKTGLNGSVSASTSRNISNSINIQNGNNNLINAISDLKDDLIGIKDELMGMTIVMDSGAVVGSISSKMDHALGVISGYKGRGN